MQHAIESRNLSLSDWNRAGAILFVGVVVHLFYLLLLTKTVPVEQWYWSGGDTASYLRPAESFLREGTFAREGVPDYRRTVGYPLFLAGCVKLSDTLGTEWRMTVYVLQALLFAFAYPVVFVIGRILFGLQDREAVWSIAFLGVMGCFISYVPLILSDALFSLSLVTGVACGLLALVDTRRGWIWALAHIGLITYAAHVRPMLAFFPVAALCAHWALLKRDGRMGEKSEKKMLVVVMLVVTLIGVQTPALRNWIYHGVLTPSEIGSINLYNYLAHDVLKFRNDFNQYENIERKLRMLEGPEHLQERIELRKEKAFEVFRESPGITAGHLFYFTVLNSIETHWQNIFYLVKKTWYRDYEDGSVVWSPLPFLMALGFIFIYGNIYLITLIALAFRPKNFLFMCSVLLFLIPYGFCGTSYQGARFRLWLEPFLVLFVFKIISYYIKKYRDGRKLIAIE